MHMTTQPRIAYDDLGEKEPAVVFLPGWCSGRGVFRDLLPLMAKTRRSLALDWRGHGESERPTGDYDSDALVQDAISVLDQAGVETVVPTDPEFFDAQLGFRRQNPWFEVQRLDAKTHFPMYERPDDMIEAIDTFATRLAT